MQYFDKEDNLLTKSSKSIVEGLKSFVFKYTKFAVPGYPYNVEPIQLSFLINEIERLKDIKGNILEIGVAQGMTTRFLCEHIKRSKLDKTLKLYAIDTFESFKKRDLDFEIKERRKSLFELKAFNYIDHDIWKRNFAIFPFVNTIKSDCASFDYSKLSPIKLIFLDVDLYLPTKNTLPKIYEMLVVGGTIVVDDVFNNTSYDGAYQAYMEFCKTKKINPQIIGNKCGVIYKK